jgi:hypothetical protein
VVSQYRYGACICGSCHSGCIYYSSCGGKRVGFVSGGCIYYSGCKKRASSVQGPKIYSPCPDRADKIYSIRKYTMFILGLFRHKSQE